MDYFIHWIKWNFSTREVVCYSDNRNKGEVTALISLIGEQERIKHYGHILSASTSFDFENFYWQSAHPSTSIVHRVDDSISVSYQ